MTTDEGLFGALRQVLDPEVGINIVDLGLVQSAHCEGGWALVEMILTSPTCPMGSYLEHAIYETLAKVLPDLRLIEIKLLSSPLWSPERMSAGARRQLGWDTGS